MHPIADAKNHDTPPTLRTCASPPLADIVARGLVRVLQA